MKILSHKFECKLLPRNSLEEKKYIKKLKFDIAVVDKLKEKTVNIKIFQKNCGAVVAIDYTANNKNIFQYGSGYLYKL